MYLPGVGPNKKDVLNKELGVRTWGDLLEYYPYKYVDRSRIYAIHELQSDMPFVQIRGKILSFEEFEMSARKKRVVAHFSDGRGVVDLVWFSGAQYIYKTYKVGEDYIVFGRPTVYGGRFQFSHPEIERASELQLSEMGMQPYYVTTEQMKKRNISSRAVEKMVKAMLQKIAEPIPETLPDFIVNARHLVSRDTALRCVHYPKNAIEMQKARERLKFEELFYVQLNILRYASDHRRKYRGYVFSQVGDDFHRFYSENLRFELTGAQKRVVHEIRDDMRSGRQMNRLLQGDVGSGKTLVALMTMLIALGNGYQACIMAPTEILAEQHFATIQEFLHGLDIRVELLTGQVKGKRRQEVLDALIAGEVKILVGTHAVLEDPVRFQRLGVAVIDEQHRFGVEQRNALGEKGKNPHLYVMSATPIPRTLALIIYGELDISILDELPPGRQKIETYAVTSELRQRAYNYVKKHLDAGRQGYIICPLVDEGESDTELASAVKYADELQHGAFRGYTVGLMHGKMKIADKKKVMESFSKGETQLLVSTTVIEVGVDVPNAVIMVIENAERFGLSQLHQLRGRIGRGQYKSTCILITDAKNDTAQRRMKVMETTTDGFKIADEDLRLRGPGEFFGSRQHGLPEMKIADMLEDRSTLEETQRAAKEIIARAPELSSPESAALKNEIQRLFDAVGNAGMN